MPVIETRIMQINKEVLIFLIEIVVTLLGVLLFIALRSCGHEWLGIRLLLTVFISVMWTHWFQCIRSGHFGGMHKKGNLGQFALRKWVTLTADTVGTCSTGVF